MYNMYTTPYHTSLTIPYHIIRHHYHTIPYHTTPHHTIPYHTIPYHTTIPYTTPIQYRHCSHQRKEGLFVHSIQELVFDVDTLSCASWSNKENRPPISDHYIQQVGVAGGGGRERGGGGEEGGEEKGREGGRVGRRKGEREGGERERGREERGRERVWRIKGVHKERGKTSIQS